MKKQECCLFAILFGTGSTSPGNNNAPFHVCSIQQLCLISLYSLPQNCSCDGTLVVGLIEFEMHPPNSNEGVNYYAKPL